jgi:hypothetical protein
LDPDKFKLGDPAEPNNVSPNPGRLCILDVHGQPILYFPANPARPELGVAPGYVGGLPAAAMLMTAAPPESLSTGALYEFSHSIYYGPYYQTDGSPATGYPSSFVRVREPDKSKALARMRAYLGDLYDESTNSLGPDGLITTVTIGGASVAEAAATTDAYLLWCAGVDKEYGPDFGGSAPTPAEVRECDDVTSFRR